MNDDHTVGTRAYVFFRSRSFKINMLIRFDAQVGKERKCNLSK